MKEFSCQGNTQPALNAVAVCKGFVWVKGEMVSQVSGGNQCSFSLAAFLLLIKRYTCSVL